MRRLLTALVMLPLALTGCVSDGKFLEDYAACPATDGADCTADTQDRVDALSALPGVTEVVSVERSENLDQAPTVHGDLLAEVADEQAALELAAQALAILNDWPEHDDASMTLLLTADPPVEIDYVGRSDMELSEVGFDPCADPDCREAVAQVQSGVEEEYAGVGDLTFRREGDTMLVRGTVDSAEAESVARAVQRQIFEAGFRLAPQVDILIRGRAPLSLEYHVQRDVVCGVPPQTHEDCEGRDTVPFVP